MKKILIPALLGIALTIGCKKKDTPTTTTPTTFSVHCKAQSGFGVLTEITIKVNNVAIKEESLANAANGHATFDTTFNAKAGDNIYMIAYPYDVSHDAETALSITANGVITKATYRDSDKKGVSYTLPK